MIILQNHTVLNFVNSIKIVETTSISCMFTSIEQRYFVNIDSLAISQ
jgi:hypothetical protein